MIPNLHGPWLLLAALLAMVAALRGAPRPPRRELIWIVALCLAAAVARLSFGLWTLLHVNGQAPLWIRGALEPGLLEVSYGPGYFELFSWIAPLTSPPDHAIFVANALLSALSPALLYAAARLAGVRSGGALAAAAVLAADPVAIRTAATELYIWPLIAFTLTVEVMLALFALHRGRGNRSGAAWSLLAAGLFAAAGARIHPVGYLPLALAPLVVFGSAHHPSWGARLQATVVAAVALAVCTLLVSGQFVVHASGVSPVDARIALAELGVAQLKLMVALLLAVWLWHWWSYPPWLPLLAVASVLLVPVVDSGFSNEPFQAIFYNRLCLPGILLGASALLPRPFQSPGWSLALAIVGVVFLAQPALPFLARRTTEQLEYDFLRTVLRDHPKCTLASVSRAGRRLWEIPSFLVPETGNQRAVNDVADLQSAPGSCLLYVHASICSSVEARDLCAAVEREVPMERLANAVFPAIPSYAGLPYDRPEVEVGLFRVSGHRRGVSDGLAITPAFAQRLYQRLTGLQEPDGCRMTRFDTSRFRAGVGLQPASGSEQTIEIAANTAGSGWSLVAPPESEHDCAATLAAMRRALEEIGKPSGVAEVEIER